MAVAWYEQLCDDRKINKIVLNWSDGRKINVQSCLLAACLAWLGLVVSLAPLSDSQCLCQTSTFTTIATNCSIAITFTPNGSFQMELSNAMGTK